MHIHEKMKDSKVVIHTDFSELNLNSIVKDIPNFKEYLRDTSLGNDVFLFFKNNQNIPGIIILNEFDKLVTVISRRKFLEMIGKPYGVDVFLKRTLSFLLDGLPEPLVLNKFCSIEEACQQALNRPQESVYEPIVYYNDGYHLIDIHTMLLAQSKLLSVSNDKVREQKRITELILRASGDLSASLDTQEVVLNSVKSIQQLFFCDFIQIYLRKRESYQILYTDNKNTNEYDQKIIDFIFQQIDETHSIYIYNFNTRLSGYPNYHTWLGIPLIVHGSEIGVILVSFHRELAFDEEILSLSQVLTSHISSALQNSYTFEVEQTHRKQLQMLNEATSTLLNIVDLENLVHSTLDQAMEITNSEFGKMVVFLPQKDNKNDYFYYQIGEPSPGNDITELNNVIEYFCNNPEEINNDIMSFSKSHFINVITNVVLIPLLNNKNIFGFIVLAGDNTKFFLEKDNNLLLAYLSLVSTAFDKVKLLEEIRYISNTDSLTNIYNRRGFYGAVEDKLIHSLETKKPISAIMVDLDNFKRINDYYGHQIGDNVIQTVVKRCLKTLRPIDTGCRFGGEEFLFLIPDSDIKQAKKVADRLRQKIYQRPIITDKGEMEITVSIGVSTIELSNENPAQALEQMINRADQAMYWSKIQGRNRVSLWSENAAKEQVMFLNDQKKTFKQNTLTNPSQDLLQLQSSMLAAEEHLSSILTNASEAIITINQENQIVVFNHSAEKVFLYSLQEIIGKQISVLIPNIDEILKKERRITSGKSSTLGLTQQNQQIPLEISYSSFMAKSQLLTTIIISDITERKLTEEKLSVYHKNITTAYDNTIEALVHALEFRDIETHGHSKRVVELTTQFAQMLGYSEEELINIRRGALLHDIGKIAISDQILLKPGPLTEDEWIKMHQHPRVAYELLSSIQFLIKALVIPLYHHERYDGSGYPYQLVGDEIPFEARLFAIVDIYDALRSDRPYRAAWSEEKTRCYLQEQAGKAIDGNLLPIFFQVLDQFNSKNTKINRAAKVNQGTALALDKFDSLSEKIFRLSLEYKEQKN